MKSKTLAIEASGAGAVVWAGPFCTQAQGTTLMCHSFTSYSSDIHDDWRRRFSTNNGATWSDWEAIDGMFEETSEGTLRRKYRGGFVDPATGRFVIMMLEGLLPNDNPLDGMKHWQLRYCVSDDGGQTCAVNEFVVQNGAEYTVDHPIEGVWVGQDSFMVGAPPCVPIKSQAGKILVPIAITPLGPNGDLYNPGGGYTYHDSAVLIGTWTDDMKIEWDVSERVIADPAKSTRGADEPTITEMPNGKILMVCRGSNDVKPQLPGYKWYSVSEDGGHTWSDLAPWTFTDGDNFFSPASCSQLLKHSNGKYYWIGNVVDNNPTGNSPRYPLVIGEVDPDNLLLIEDTLVTIDELQAGENGSLQLSNFLAYEDRLNGDIVMQMTRFFPQPVRDGDSFTYRIGVPVPEPTGFMLLAPAIAAAAAYARRNQSRATAITAVK
ncbi:MAG: exo-alpha-sialidase [Pirellulales bacterium]|nr:exo-alpha-sialidase [Pirellulales bacterium]